MADASGSRICDHSSASGAFPAFRNRKEGAGCGDVYRQGPFPCLHCHALRLLFLLLCPGQSAFHSSLRSGGDPCCDPGGGFAIMEAKSPSFHSGGKCSLYGAGSAFYPVKRKILPGSFCGKICIFHPGRLYCLRNESPCGTSFFNPLKQNGSSYVQNFRQ